MSAPLTPPIATTARRSPYYFLLPALPAAVAYAVTSGGQVLRAALLGVLACLMSLPLLSSLEAGMIALMLFEPNRGLLRRAQYLIVDYAAFDPIHALSPAVTLFAFAALLRVRGRQVLTASPLAPAVTLLTIIYVLQIFNPLQGGIGVGLTGVIYMLVPMLWFYFGQEARPAFLAISLKLVIALGLVCSLHGIYQLAAGFPSFEQYWISHTEFYESIAVGHVQRALATFSSAEEWGRYIEFGAVAAFGFALNRRYALVRVGYFGSGLALAAMLFVTGQRSSIFGLLFGVVVLLLLGARTRRAAAQRLALIAACAALVLAVAKPPSEDEMWRKGEDEKVGTMLSHSARGTLNPAKEESLQARFETWTYLATEVIPYRPLGAGLGAGSLAAWRAGGKEQLPIDSFVLVVVVACGVPALLLLAWVLGRAALLSVRLARAADENAPEFAVARIIAALVAALILNNLVGLTFSIYSCAPLGWLWLGWVSAAAGQPAVASPDTSAVAAATESEGEREGRD